MVGSLRRKSQVNGNLRTNPEKFDGVLHLLQQPYWIEYCF